MFSPKWIQKPAITENPEKLVNDLSDQSETKKQSGIISNSKLFRQQLANGLKLDIEIKRALIRVFSKK